jgi:hypothetical protein
MTISSTRLLMVAAFMAVLSAQAALWADPPIQVGRVSLISGEVSFRPGSLDDWAPATLNYPLTAGDSLWTDAGGRAEIHVGGAAIRLDSDTEFSFLNLDDQTVQVRLSQGTLNVRVRSLDPGDSFEIDTPNSSVSLLAEGSYRIDVQDSGDTVVVVRQGETQVTAGEDAFNVPAGQSATVSGTGSIAYYLQDVSAPDDWDAWCANRDQREDRVASVHYVSRDMIGMEDLDDHGTWLVVAGYGQVWAPAGVPLGWAPYRFGRWAWVEPWGWTWIDDAPWGFAPFHYGRWAYASRGWVWVPGTMVARPVYAPALVVFVGGNNWSPAAGDGIGWFPLGPHEPYVPPYAVSPGYARRINVAHVSNFQSGQSYDATRATYVNRNVPQAVTVVHRDDFVQSRRTSGAVIAVPFAEVGRAPVMGMTAFVVPQRESVIAQPFAPQTRVVRPPENVASRSVYSRRAPPPPQVPFAARQQALMANPGRPLSREQLTALQKNRPGSQPPVTVVGPGSVNRVDNPPAYRDGQQPPARNAPAPGGAMIAPPPRNAPAPPQVDRGQQDDRNLQGGRGQQLNRGPQQGGNQPVDKGQQGGSQPPGKGQQAGNQPADRGQQGDKNQKAAAGQSQAASLIGTLKTQSLPKADSDLAAAQKAGVRLDFNAISKQLASARSSLAGAEKDLAAGNASSALQKATSIQKQISDVENAISAAMKSGGSNQKDQNDNNSDNGDNRTKPRGGG